MFHVEIVILMPNQANSGYQDRWRTITTRSPILDCKYLFKQLQHRGEVARELLVLRSLRNWESNQQVMHKSSGGNSCLQIETQESNPFKYQRISVIMVGLTKVLQTFKGRWELSMNTSNIFVSYRWQNIWRLA